MKENTVLIVLAIIMIPEDNVYERGVCIRTTFCKAENGPKLGVNNFFEKKSELQLKSILAF